MEARKGCNCTYLASFEYDPGYPAQVVHPESLYCEREYIQSITPGANVESGELTIPALLRMIMNLLVTEKREDRRVDEKLLTIPTCAECLSGSSFQLET